MYITEQEIIYWLQWVKLQQPGKETEVLYTPTQMGGIIVNLN